MSIYPHSFRTKNSITKTTSYNYGEYYEKTKMAKIHVEPDLKKLLHSIDTNRPQFQHNLSEFIQVPSISGYKQYFNALSTLQIQVKKWLEKLNVVFETFDVGTYESNGLLSNVPNVILGTLIVDQQRPTIGVYAHIDIKLTDHHDWNNLRPYQLTTKDGCFYGAGTACGKGPLLMWFHAIETFNEMHIPLPVNIKFCIESMHECNHQNLEAFIRSQKTNFLKDIDHWVVNESTWLGNIIPCVVYGAVGFAHFHLTSEQVENSDSEPRDDLMNIHSTLLDENDEITIEKFHSTVQHITPDEEMIYEKIRDFNVNDVRLSLPEYKRDWNKLKLLMHFWRLPSLQISDIEECCCPKKHTLPTKVKSVLLFKIVPNQYPEMIDNLVQTHIQQVIEQFKIKNKIECKMVHGARPWIEDLDSIPYVAAKRATIQVYKEVPNLIREDESFSIVLLLQRVFHKEILLLPLGRSDGNPREPNENISIHCFFEGTKLLCSYLFQVLCVTMQQCHGEGI